METPLPRPAYGLMASSRMVRVSNLKNKIMSISDRALLNLLRKKFVSWGLHEDRKETGVSFRINPATIRDDQLDECFRLIQEYEEVNTNSHEHKTEELTQKVLETDPIQRMGRLSLADNEKLQRLLYNEKLRKQRDSDRGISTKNLCG